MRGRTNGRSRAAQATARSLRLHLQDDPTGVRNRLAELHPADAADLLNQLPAAQAAQALALLPVARAARIFNQHHLRRRGKLLEDLEPALAAQLLARMPADERIDVLQQAGTRVGRRLIPELPGPLRAEAERLLQYPPHTAGGIMTTEFVRLEPGLTVGQSLARVRQMARDFEHIYACYVLDPEGRLLSAVSLRDLVLADEQRPITEVMTPNPVSVQVLEDQESVAGKISRYNLLAVPVVEPGGRVVGFVTVDDVIDVLIEEQTEDVLRAGAVEPGALDEPYLEAPFWRLVRKRAGWLVFLFLGEMLTATAMGFFENEIARAVVLALFVPLIISSGGNSGSQAATLIVRALALGEVRLRDWWRVVRRELGAGVALGAVLGSIGFVRIALWSLFVPLYGRHWPLVGLTVALALVGVVTWGTLSGSLLPILLKRLGFDPASSSAPFVATLVDVTGLVIYFSIAALVLRGTLL
jgi:magnesium transporter